MNSKLALADAVNALEAFVTSDLTSKVAEVEASMRGATAETCANAISLAGANSHVFGAAALMKEASGQIDVIIHALGILLCLPHLMEKDETVEYLSLGAGNTGRAFDLETNLRIAEFKFINWRGGPESIRQNSIFKDFFGLAESESNKRKFLYVLGVDHPMKFFRGGRSLKSVLSRGDKVKILFESKYGERFKKVREYYSFREGCVEICDVSSYLV